MYDSEAAWNWYSTAYRDLLPQGGTHVIRAVFEAGYRLGSDDSEELDD